MPEQIDPCPVCGFDWVVLVHHVPGVLECTAPGCWYRNTATALEAEELLSAGGKA